VIEDAVAYREPEVTGEASYCLDPFGRWIG
jgi:hypothetical protein